MVQKYKEIVFGVIFGWVAVVMDTFIDADMQGRSFWTELVEHPAMLFYRAIFLLFGLALGWLLWRRNKTERDFRTLAENWRKIQHEYSGKVLLLHTKLMVLITREDLRLSPETAELLQSAYLQSVELQKLIKNWPPPNA
jgi:hypothetical protein